MRRILFYTLLILTFNFNLFSQTAGDIAIIQFRSDAEDGFSFVALTDIAGDSSISFTDNAWNDTVLLSNESTIIWTAPVSGVSAGTVITWQNNAGVDVGAVSGSLNALAGGGDQIIAYTGNAATPNFLFALSTTAWLTTGQVSTNTSYLPVGLVNDSTAFSFNPHADNGYYNIASNAGEAVSILASICNFANWISNDDGTLTFQPSPYWTFSIGATLEPSILEFSVVNNGNNVYLNIPFEVEVVLKDSLGNLATATSDISVTLSKLTGAGTLSGNQIGTITTGSSSIVFSGLTYDVAETGVSLLIQDDSTILLSDTSNVFEVIYYYVPDIVITEIMFDPPETPADSLEFLEIYNNDTTVVNLENYSFSGVTYTFPVMNISPGQYIVIAEDSVAFENFFGVTAYDFSGSLINSGEPLALYSEIGVLIDSVYYTDAGDWPVLNGEEGPSIELCDPALDNNLALSWSAAIIFVDTNSVGDSIFATPGSGCILPTPSVIKIISVNSGINPVLNIPFDVKLRLEDSFGNQAVAADDISVTLEKVSGTGNLGGNLSGIITSGSSMLTVSGVTYDVAESVVSLRVIDDSVILEADTSLVFEVLETPPTPYQLAFKDINNGLSPNVNTPFDVTIEVRDSLNNVILADAAISISLTLASGTGIIGGNLSGIIPDGASEFVISGVTYDTEESGVSLIVSDDSIILLSDTSQAFDVLGINNQLIISEVADPADFITGRFVEIYNAGSTTINFDSETYYISRQTNGGATWNELQLSGIIAPGQALIIANDSSDFHDVYGFAPDHVIPGTSGNGNDAYFLYKGGDHNSGALHDIYGEIDTDGVGTAWQYEDGGSYRIFSVTNPNTLWTASEWYMISGNLNELTPGLHIPVTTPTHLAIVAVNNNTDAWTNIPFQVVVQIQDSTNSPVITMSSIQVELTVGTGSGALSGTTIMDINAGSSGVVFDVSYNMAESNVTLLASDADDQYASGESVPFNVIEANTIPDIVITEIMYHSPVSGTDSLEFIEIFNNDTIAVNLENYYFEGVTFTFPLDTIQPGEFRLIAGNSIAFEGFYGLPAYDYSYTLSNSGELLSLLDNYNRIVDSVFYDNTGDWPYGTDGQGSSLTFCNPSLDNSNPLNWSISANYIDTVAGLQVFATPGGSCIVPEPISLKIASVNSGVSPLVDSPFDMIVEAIAMNGVAANVTTDVNLSLNLITGSGTLAGTLTGIITTGNSSVTISGITYDTAETDISIEVTDSSMILTADTSYLFDVVVEIPVPTQLVITSVNYGTDPEYNTPFDIQIECRDSSNNLANVTSDVIVTLTKGSGAGTLGGTLSDTIAYNSSSITISGLTYNITDSDVSIIVSDNADNLLSDTSYLFNVTANYITVYEGDIAFVQYHTDTVNGFSFLALEEIPASAEIKFTDNGFDGLALTSTENILTWTAPVEGIQPGTVISWQNNMGVDLGTVTGTFDGLSEAGDQIIAYQGSENAPVFIYALSTVPWVSGSLTNETESQLPGTLENGVTAIYFNGYDNGNYDTSKVLLGYADILRISIGDTLNWITRNSNYTPFLNSDYFSFGIWGEGIDIIPDDIRKLTVYPVPASDYIVTNYSGDAEILYISNLLGSYIQTINIADNKQKIDISGLNPGIYLLTIKYSDGNSETCRFIKY